MAAPSGTVWGPIVQGSKAGRQGKLGIYTSVTNTNTTTTVNIQVWFATIYSCTDGDGVGSGQNCLYYDNGPNVSSATTSIGEFSIQHEVDTGAGWNTANQTRLINETKTYDRKTSAYTHEVYAKLTGIDMLGATVYANTSYTIPALTSYAVTYNANGGSGAPSGQTKYYGKTLTLSSTKPTRTGYSFQGWATSASGSVAYSAGASYTANAEVTLYAVWKANTYTVKYDANGGTGAPGNQTKTYGVNLTLSSTKPTRKNYNFLGWGTSSTATTASYKAGGTYTSNTAITLYAVWELAYVKPRITNSMVTRCTLDSTPTVISTDDATNACISFSWASDNDVTSIKIAWKKSIEDTWSTDVSIPASGKSGSVIYYIWADFDSINNLATLVGVNNYKYVDEEFSAENVYDFRITVTDTESSYEIKTVAAAIFPIDLLPENKGMAFGKPAELEGVADFAYQVRLLGGVLYTVLEPEIDLNDILVPGFYVGANVSTYNYAHCPLTSGTFTLEVKSSGPSGQVRQILTLCDKKKSQAYDRFYYGGDWQMDSNGEYIWFGQWIYPTLGSEFAMYGTDENANRPKYRKDGRVVEVRGIVTPVNDIVGGTDMHNIFTLADGYRPSSPIYVVCQGSGNCTWLLRIASDGTVALSRYRNGDSNATASDGAWLPFQVTFLTN